MMIVLNPCSYNYVKEPFPTDHLHTFNDWLISQRRWVASFNGLGRKIWVLRLTLGNKGFNLPWTPFLLLSNGIISPLMLFTTILDHFILYSTLTCMYILIHMSILTHGPYMYIYIIHAYTFTSRPLALRSTIRIHNNIFASFI